MSAKYQAYAEYKDSGVEWLGDIPKHWQLTRIKHIAELTPKKPNIQRNFHYRTLFKVGIAKTKKVVM